MSIKLIIFDLDGVLVDACEWHRIALNAALKSICNYEITTEEHYKLFNGLPTMVKLGKLSDMGIIKSNKHKEIYDEKQKLTIETIEKLAFRRDEKILLMEYIKNKNCNIACYTNSIRKTATMMLEKTGVLPHIDYLLTNQDVRFAKPDPEGYNSIVEKFNINKNDVLIVEDSPKGKLAAYASGCKVLEVQCPDEVLIKIFEEYF